jgi:hypothetical protein
VLSSSLNSKILSSITSTLARKLEEIPMEEIEIDLPAPTPAPGTPSFPSFPKSRASGFLVYGRFPFPFSPSSQPHARACSPPLLSSRDLVVQSQKINSLNPKIN